MLPFQEATQLTQSAGGWRAYLPEEWSIWGPNGGFMAALALRAAGKAVPAGFAPVTLSCQFLGGALVGEAELRIVPAKQGRRATCANIALVQNNAVVAQAQVWSAPLAQGPDRMDRVPPDVARPADLDPFDASALPKFWANIERRRVDYHPINRANPKGCVRPDWYRFEGFNASGDPYVDDGRCVLMIDTVQWATHLEGLDAEPDYAAPNLDLTVWFNRSSSLDDWLLVNARSDTASAGRIFGAADVWNEANQLIATGASHMLCLPRAPKHV